MGMGIPSPMGMGVILGNNEHVYSPTKQRDRQRQTIYSWLKYTVNSSYTLT